MKLFFARLTSAPHLIRMDLLLLLLPLVLWSGLTLLRPYLITPHCLVPAGQTSLCHSENVLPVDRVALGLNSSDADRYSYYTQNFSGVLAFSAPVLWHGLWAVLGRTSPLMALTGLSIDLAIITEITLWNGAIGETVRIISQRPRPFVYADTASAGANPAHYISFYSGHTSFAAAASLGFVLFLLGRGAPGWLTAFSFIGFELLTFSTGIFRILAGRHFVTDVLAAAVAGSVIAFTIAWLHRDKSPEV
ncbi:MAG TPA: hypothetical protein DCS07_14395 [Bdellovibrionales bacterium]|nr:MAG: hypothetical protein A2Z97_09490 [Bdellovibrionales bacterium GWB1_52_6]OFZ03630.1 MAG: hypothetical protein A2X97_00875 [Bdellovibrionales bacterium GWA1_52_35]OFZ41637.1 MAG: hypothetical protein A2070_10660 [Bdellovibrionales bacterium GWC1_52_8]HAR43802.1 hypothetical protein [Bdellovibrionales bacterium]HCM40646.1 hypothetical protein [Bdellovibrionales bacterium]